ncbi:MAG: NADAR family protein [Prosthecobacter sp.]|nr:NADAR family protein [Prosthecobacter sp.]
MNADSQLSFKIRDRDSLVQAMQSGLRPKWLLFWGHTPSKDGSITKSCFSQWWARHPFTHQGVLYPTAEHFMMAGKARLFHDANMLSRILAAKSAAQAKKLGRLIQGFDELKWRHAHWDIVVQGNLAKFKQHPDLCEYLLQTNKRVLVEASPYDRIWGIGMAADDERSEKPACWKGLNLLGFALMEAREQLRAETETA